MPDNDSEIEEIPTIFTPTGEIDECPTITWEEAVHQARVLYGMIDYPEVSAILKEEGWGFERKSERYVLYGPAR